MSKGYSAHFSGTRGAKIHEGTAERLRLQVITWAEEMVKILEKKSKRQRDKFNTAAIIYDERTGKYYNGRNHGIEIDHDARNPVLFGDTMHQGLLPKESLNHYVVGNCAEIHAVNKALNDGAQLCDLILYTIHTTTSDFGKIKQACENCTYTLKGRIKKNYSGWKDGE